MERIKVGDKAREFTLKDQTKQDVRLSSFKGKKVLISFHPLAWTGVCADQMKSLETNLKNFEELNTVALGVSVDTIPSKNAWAKELGIKNTKLLSDFWPHGDIAKLYGIFRETEGSSERANIIIDEDQKVIFVKVYPSSELPDIKEIIDVIKQEKVLKR